jgi:ATP-dependent Lon protease
MTLPSATLFPQALLPLYIFEPRYRQMLADVLHANRMFAVAMQKPGRMREVPAPIAGLGVVRVSVGHKDGTSHLVLQGLVRVELKEAVRYKPYRVQRIRVLETATADRVAVDALVAKVRELLAERLKLGFPFPFPTLSTKGCEGKSAPSCSEFAAKDMLDYVNALKNPEFVADLVSCAVLRGPDRRQTILETLDIEARLRRLILFLRAEIEEYPGTNHE